MDMFQKLEKVLRRIHRTRKNNLFLIQFIFFFDVLYAQIDQRFDLYDWEIIRQNESVNSISEGYQYIFFATDANGILRFNKFSRNFESNLFLGQGIKSNKIKHVYVDRNTGILWIIGNRGLEFSSTREGSWNRIQLNNLSINSLKSIEDLGSSKSFLWIKTTSRFIKLDHVSGSFLGIFTYPDEKNIDWGDFNFNNRYSLKDFSFNLKDLKSRTNSFIFIGINLPTDELLKVIISKSFSEKQIDINPKTIDYIIKNIERSYEKILRFLRDIDELSLSSGKSININLIKKVLNK